MSISERIDGLLEQHSLLKHPFYQAWSDGKLEMESLAGYSKEYYQLVKAVPEFMNPLIEMALIPNQSGFAFLPLQGIIDPPFLGCI